MERGVSVPRIPSTWAPTGQVAAAIPTGVSGHALACADTPARKAREGTGETARWTRSPGPPDVEHAEGRGGT